MKKFMRVLTSLIGSLIALAMVHFFNIFDYIPLVQPENSYDIGVAVYFSLTEMAVGMLFDWFVGLIEKSKTHIEAILYLPNQVPNETVVPRVRLNNMGMAEMILHVRVHGKCKKVKDSQIMISSFLQAEMQFARRGTGTEIDDNGNVLINLKAFCNKRAEIQCEEDYKIVLQRGAIDNSANIVLKPEIKSNVKLNGTKFICNEADIVLEEK